MKKVKSITIKYDDGSYKGYNLNGFLAALKQYASLRYFGSKDFDLRKEIADATNKNDNSIVFKYFGLDGFVADDDTHKPRNE